MIAARRRRLFLEGAHDLDLVEVGDLARDEQQAARAAIPRGGVRRREPHDVRRLSERRGVVLPEVRFGLQDAQTRERLGRRIQRLDATRERDGCIEVVARECSLRRAVTVFARAIAIAGDEEVPGEDDRLGAARL